MRNESANIESDFWIVNNNDKLSIFDEIIGTQNPVCM
jgi:hypothetical protein